MNTRSLTTALAASFALALSAEASLFPERTNTPYGVPVRMGEQPVAPAAPAAPETTAPVYTAAPPPPMPPAGRAATLPMPPMRPHASLDIRGFYGFRAVPHSTHATDMAGLEGEFAWYVTPRQAITLGASFGAGGNDSVNYIHTPRGMEPVSEDFTRTDFTLMLGYRFTQMLTPRTSISFALRGGLDVQELSYDEYGGCWGDDCDCHDRSYGETGCGFAYAASVMLVTNLTRRTMLQLGYQFRGATTKPDAPSVMPGGEPVQAHSLRWHEVHLGVRILF